MQGLGFSPRMAMAGLAPATFPSCESWRKSPLLSRTNLRMTVVVAMGRRNGAARGVKTQNKRRMQTQRRKLRERHGDEGRKVPEAEDVGEEEEEQSEDEDDDDKEAELENNALEALFAQLEKDLKAADERNDPYMTEEQMVAFEREHGLEMEEKPKTNKRKKEVREPVVQQQVEDDPEDGEDDSKGGEDDPDDTRSGLQKFIEQAEMIESQRVARRIVKLEKRQLLMLKAALDLKKGEVKIKSLAEETGLDRRDVLTFLRNPPAELLEIVDSLSDDEEDEPPPQENVVFEVKKPKPVKKPAGERIGIGEELNQTSRNGPREWYAKKRIRKQHLETFELVFSRSKRPTGTMIQSMVDLTHVPRKRILDWFEKRRHEHSIKMEERRMLFVKQNAEKTRSPMALEGGAIEQ